MPTGTAFFGTSNTTALSILSPSAVGGWTFNAGASNYTFTILGGNDFFFNGAGIEVNGGSAGITIGGGLIFLNSSTAGGATITANAGGGIVFVGSTSGGTARFILNGTGYLDVSQLTTAGTTAGSIEGDGNVYLGGKNLVLAATTSRHRFPGSSTMAALAAVPAVR